MPAPDTARAVIEAARAIADAERKAAMDAVKRLSEFSDWRTFVPPRILALIDALAQYDREAKDE